MHVKQAKKNKKRNLLLLELLLEKTKLELLKVKKTQDTIISVYRFIRERWPPTYDQNW